MVHQVQSVIVVQVGHQVLVLLEHQERVAIAAHQERAVCQARVELAQVELLELQGIQALILARQELQEQVVFQELQELQEQVGHQELVELLVTQVQAEWLVRLLLVD